MNSFAISSASESGVEKSLENNCGYSLSDWQISKTPCMESNTVIYDLPISQSVSIVRCQSRTWQTIPSTIFATIIHGALELINFWYELDNLSGRLLFLLPPRQSDLTLFTVFNLTIQSPQWPPLSLKNSHTWTEEILFPERSKRAADSMWNPYFIENKACPVQIFHSTRYLLSSSVWA